MNRRLWLCGLLILAGALWLRLPGLERRPMHNDEAINATKLAGLWDSGAYRYDAQEYHGPSLYYLTLPFVWVSGARSVDQVSEATLRLAPVFFGATLILLLFLLADGLGAPATLGAALLLAVSPAMVFYSRYFIHEILLVCFTMMLLGFGWRYLRTGCIGCATLAGVGLGLMYATKETFILSLGALALAGALTWCVGALGRARLKTAKCCPMDSPPLDADRTANRLAGTARPTSLAQVGRAVPASRSGWLCQAQPHLKPALAALAAAAVVGVVLFTSFFTNASGPLDSLRTYLPWLHRAGGHSPHIHPWYFYLERLGWFHPARSPVWSEGLILLLAGAGTVAGFTRRGLAGINPGLVQFLSWYTLILTATYSAIAYKTPWCLLNFELGLILLAGVGAVALVRWLRVRALQGIVALALLAGAGHLGWQAWRATHAFEADRRNPYVYAHTSPNLLELVRKVKAIAAVHPDKTQVLVKVLSRESYWPLPWYLREFKRVGWYDQMPADPYAPIVIAGASLGAALDDKSNKAWLMPGLYELRPGVFLELYVKFDLWKTYVESLPAVREE